VIKKTKEICKCAHHTSLFNIINITKWKKFPTFINLKELNSIINNIYLFLQPIKKCKNSTICMQKITEGKNVDGIVAPSNTTTPTPPDDSTKNIKFFICINKCDYTVLGII
jgi:hypothetical protein